jgi:hypothetical protein
MALHNYVNKIIRDTVPQKNPTDVMLADISLKQIEISLFSFENTLKWCLPFEIKI